MADNSENVKIPAATLHIYREWAEATGRSLTGLCNTVLLEAGMHYMEGSTAGVKLAAQAIRKAKP